MNTTWTAEQLKEILGLLGVDHVVAEHNRIVRELEQQAQEELRDAIRSAYSEGQENRDRHYDLGRG